MRQEGFPCGKHCDASLNKITLGLGGRELELDALGKGAGRERMRLLRARRRVRQILKHSEVIAVSLTQRHRSTPNRDERIEEK